MWKTFGRWLGKKTVQGVVFIVKHPETLDIIRQIVDRAKEKKSRDA